MHDTHAVASPRMQDFFTEIQVCASLFHLDPEEAADCPRLVDLLRRLAMRSSQEPQHDAR